MQCLTLAVTLGLGLLIVGAMADELETLTASDKQAFLDAHNAARRAENVGLNDLVWDDELASKVAGLALGCEFKHSTNPSWGENLMATSVKTISNADVAAQATNMWVSEKSTNTDGSFGCMLSSCGHYTQVIWSTSTNLGCAVSHCNTWGLGTMVVCAYSPPGNWWGMAPY